MRTRTINRVGGGRRISGPSGGGGAFWTPSSLSGTTAWWDGQYAPSRWQDSSLTVPAVANNDPGEKWLPRVGSVVATGTTTTRPLLDLTGINGLPAWKFGSKRFVTDSFLSSAYNTAFTYFAVTRQSGASLQVASSHNGVTWYHGSYPAATVSNTSGLSDTQTFKIKSPSVAVEIVRYNGSTRRHWHNGIEQNEAATGNLGLNGTLTIGDLSSGGFAWAGWVGEMGFVNRSITDAELFTLADYLSGHWNQPWRTAKRVVFDGNSLTLGTGVTTDLPYPNKTMTGLGSTWEGIQFGVSSQTTAQMSSDAPTQIDPLILAGATKNVLVGWEGTNSLYFGATAAQTITDLQTYYQARRAAGYKVVAVTILPRSGGATPGTFETDRQTVNTWLRDPARIGVDFDVLADVAADTRIGDAGDETNATYYTDLVHMTSAGYQIVADIVAVAVAAA